MTKNLVAACTLILAAVTVMSFMGGYWWGFDRLADGRLQLLLCSFLGFAVLLIAHMVLKEGVRWLVLSVLLIAVNAQPVISFSLSRASFDQQTEGKETIRVMSLNLLTRNVQHQKVIEEVRRHDPDVVLMLEANNRWVRELSLLKTDYSHRISVPQQNNFGMLIFSKYPFAEKQVEYLGKYHLPYIRATLQTGSGKRFDLIGIHTIPPMTEEMHWDNHNQLKFHFEQAQQTDHSVILMGDFNKTPWSHSYRELVSAGSLHNAASGWLPYSTWNRRFLGGLLIDHVMVRNLHPIRWQVGGPVGSDHRPVIADLSFL